MSFPLPGQRVVLEIGVTTLLFGENLTPAYARSRSIKKTTNFVTSVVTGYIGVCTKRD